MTRLSAELWSSAAGTYQAILDHAFLAELAAGTLPRGAFSYFVVQDAHYLRDYARALALVAARATTPAATRMFADHAAAAIAVEQDLHLRLLDELGLDESHVDAVPAAPVTLAYTSYLLSVCATGSYAEAVAAVLPCYWIYREVGRTLLARSSPDPAYATWIDTYGAPEFDAVVSAVIAEMDRLGAELSRSQRLACRHHFQVTSRYEWMFWDAAYQQLRWPLPLTAGPGSR